MEESRLIQRASEGDASAFNSLMGMHERRMYAVALRMCGNPEDAQDCLQEAMLRIYRAIDGFKGQSSFSTWVYRITMNTCLDELRRRKNRPNTSLDGLYDAGWSPVDPGATPEKHALLDQVNQDLLLTSDEALAHYERMDLLLQDRIETLQHTNEELIATLDDLIRIQDEGREKRRNAEIELTNIEQQLKERLTQAGSMKV